MGDGFLGNWKLGAVRVAGMPWAAANMTDRDKEWLYNATSFEIRSYANTVQ